MLSRQGGAEEDMSLRHCLHLNVNIYIYFVKFKNSCTILANNNLYLHYKY